MSRTYGQGCPLAFALDHVGERWTLLLIRDLFLGPRGFADLHSGLSGIGASLLSKRLKEMEELGLVAADRIDGKRCVYRLTDLGEHLRPTIRSMMRWSVRFSKAMGEDPAAPEKFGSTEHKPDSVALAIEMFATSNADPSLSYVAHLVIEKRPYIVYYINGDLIIKRGADAPAVAKIEIDLETAMLCLLREIEPEIARKRMKMEGDPKALNHLANCIASKPKPKKKPGDKPSKSAAA